MKLTHLSKEPPVTTNPPMKYSSSLLVASLIVTSFFIVNCNKNPERVGVKSNTISGQAQVKATAQATILSTDTTPAETEVPIETPKESTVVSDDKTVAVIEVKDCSDEVLKSYGRVNSEFTRVQEIYNKNKVSKNPENLNADFHNILALCDYLGKEFDKISLKICSYKNPENTTEAIHLNKVPNQCLIIAAELYLDDGTESPYLDIYKEQQILHKKDIRKKLNQQKEFENQKKIIAEILKKADQN